MRSRPVRVMVRPRIGPIIGSLPARRNKKVHGVRPAIEKNPSIPYNSAMAYKVVEISTVTDDEIERALNEGAVKGWSFASIHFVMTEASRRPAMASLFFVDGASPGPATGPLLTA